MKFFFSSSPSGFFEVRNANGKVICFWAAPRGHNRGKRILENQTRAVAVCAALNACAALNQGNIEFAKSNAGAVKILTN